MPNRTQRPPTQRRASGDGARVARSRPEPGTSMRTASITAGTALLVMSVLAGFANFVVIDGLVTQGDAGRTATDILGSEAMYRLGVVSWVVIVVLDVLIAWALLRFFSPVNGGMSMLAAWFRLAYAAVLMVAVSQLAGIPRLLHGEEYLAVVGTEQLHAQALMRVQTFNDIWDAGLVLFGLHLLLIGYLAFKSGYVPKLLGVLLAVAGFGYVFDGFAALLSPAPAISISTFTFVGEFLLAVWLVIWGRRISLDTSALQEGVDRVGV